MLHHHGRKVELKPGEKLVHGGLERLVGGHQRKLGDHALAAQLRLHRHPNAPPPNFAAREDLHVVRLVAVRHNVGLQHGLHYLLHMADVDVAAQLAAACLDVQLCVLDGGGRRQVLQGCSGCGGGCGGAASGRLGGCLDGRQQAGSRRLAKRRL